MKVRNSGRISLLLSFPEVGNRKLAMDIHSFREISESVEQWLTQLGVNLRDEKTGEVLFECTGESLYNICVEFRYISSELSCQSLSDAIVLSVGDRTTRYTGLIGDCWGVTSHDAAGTLIYNIGSEHCLKVWKAIRSPANGMWPHWQQLSKASKSKVAAIEREHFAPTAGISELSSAVRTERLLYLKTQKQEWSPTEADVQKVKDAIAGMTFKTTNLDAIRSAAKMQKQRVSIILKMIGHKAD